jgi:hypothetical protein
MQLIQNMDEARQPLNIVVLAAHDDRLWTR